MSAARSGGATTHVRTVVLEHSSVRRAVFLGLLPTDHFDLRFPTDDQNWGSAFEDFPAQVVLVWQEDPARFRTTCARVRALPDAVDMPLVLVSRRRPGVDRSQGVEAGADGLLLLPAGAPEARQEIDYAIAARKGAPKTKARSVKSEAERPAGPLPVAPDAPAEPGPPAPAAGNWSELREQVGKLHATLDRATHYEILGIGREASAKEVTVSFHSAAIAFHPDRFVRLAEPDLRRMIYEIFKRMSKAFAVLTDPRQRSTYDQSLPGAPKTAPVSTTRSAGRSDRARTPQGRKFLEMAERSLQQRKYRAARLQLAIAMQMEPGNAVLQQMIRDVDRSIAENPETE